MADTSVKYFDSTMIGAPTLSGTAGSLIGVLDACLVNGFGVGALDSLVVAGGIATATRAAGHSQVKDGVAFISGASIGVLNGEQKVTNVTTTTFQFATTAADGAASGGITAKVAPAKWTKVFAGTNLAVYQSSDPASTKMCLRVDDTAVQSARITCFETMSDINTGTGQFPTSAQQAGGLFWDKSSNANATANAWVLVADGRFMHFARAYRSGNNPADAIVGYQHGAFGDIVTTKAVDPYGCIVAGDTSVQAGTNVGTSNAVMAFSTSGAALGLFAPRAYTGLGGSNPTGRAAPSFAGLANTGLSGAQVSGTPFPNPTDGALYLTQQYIFDAQSNITNNVLRGYTPGYYVTPQAVPVGPFLTRDVVTGVTGLTGKTLRAVVPSQNAPGGATFIDTTGPWR